MFRYLSGTTGGFWRSVKGRWKVKVFQTTEQYDQIVKRNTLAAGEDTLYKYWRPQGRR